VSAVFFAIITGVANPDLVLNPAFRTLAIVGESLPGTLVKSHLAVQSLLTAGGDTGRLQELAEW